MTTAKIGDDQVTYAKVQNVTATDKVLGRVTAGASGGGPNPTLSIARDATDVVIVPSIQDPEVIKQKFPKGYTAVTPYLRLTPQPNK